MSYLGMDARTGLRIDGRDHLAQSIGKVLSTAVGTRLRRRTFGALNADMIEPLAKPHCLNEFFCAG